MRAEPGIAELVLHEAEIGRAIQHRLGRARRVGDAQPKVDAGMAGLESREHRRQPVVRHCLAGDDPEAAPLQSGKLGKHDASVFGPCKHRAGLGQKQATRLGEFDPPPHAVEQPDVVALLQRGDGGARRRLREVQRLRRLRHVLALGNGNEDAKLIERHSVPPERPGAGRFRLS